MPQRRYQGFTLIEMVISMILIGILASVTAPLLYRSTMAAHTVYDQQGLRTQGRIALELMVQDIRNLRGNTAADLTAGSNSITVKDLNGNTVQYSLSGTDMLRTENGTAGTQLHLVSSLTFTYYDNTGAVTALVSNTYYVRIAFTLTNGSYTEDFRTTVFLRNAG